MRTRCHESQPFSYVRCTLILASLTPGCDESLMHIGCHESLLMSRQGVGAKWLREWCARASGGAASATADDTATLAVVRALLSKTSGDGIAAELYDLFGDSTDLQAVQELLELRCLSICRLPVQVQSCRLRLFYGVQMSADCRRTLSVLAQLLFFCTQESHVQVNKIGLGIFVLVGFWCRCAISTDTSPV